MELKQKLTTMDSFFGAPFIDVDEWREAPLRHRYVHGGFENTDTRFSIYFPPKEIYSGRLLQTLEGGSGGSESTAVGPLGFGALELAFAGGAYLAESNQGHFGEDLSGLRGEASVLGWRASAETARLSKSLATEMYGQPPHHSYVFGGSGGGIRSILCLENAGEVWDGAVPFMFPHQMTLEFFSTQLNVVRLLDPEQLAAVSDAVDVGGSGNPFAGLTTDQRKALASLYRLGFPHSAWLHDPMEARYVWTWDASWLTKADPTYFEDFWSVKGYAGADHPDDLAGSVIELKTTVARVVTAGDLVGSRLAQRSDPNARVGVVVHGLDRLDERFVGATLKLLSGRGAGHEVYCLGVMDDVLIGSSTSWLFEGVSPGDEILIDNRKYLAFCHYDRHQATDTYPEHDQHRVDGRPIYPQRSPFNIAGALHGRYAFRFSGKMIAIMNSLDRGAWPCGGVRYHEAAKLHFGDRLDDHFRLWWNDSASHMSPAWGGPEMSAKVIDYTGSVHQAVSDLIAWVEQGKEPPASTNYTYSADGRLTLAPNADTRRGIQPVVTASANGGVRAEVGVGESVQFEVTAEAPAGTGKIVDAEWDFEGQGTWPFKFPGIDGTSDSVRLTANYVFRKPGTYFPAVRVIAHRDGNVHAVMGRLPNLGRVRVVVR